MASNTDDSFEVFTDDGTHLSIDLAHAGGVNEFALTDEGRTLLTVGGDGRLRCWAMPSLTPLLSVRIPEMAAIRAISVIDHETIAVGDRQGSVALIRALTERP